MAKEFQIPAALVPKVWAAKVWREGNKDSYFEKFTSTDGSKPVQTNKDLKRANGDKVTFGIAMNLTGDGVTGNDTLENNEDTLTMYDFAVTTSQVRNAVARYVGDDHKSPYENLPLIKSALVQWLSDWKDDTLIKKLTESPIAGEVLGTEASITADTKLTCAMISKAKRKAMLHAPKVKPIKIDGQDKYIMLIGPYAARDLKSDTAWLEAQEHAGVRGSNNPIFTGALGEYDGVILYEYERVSTTQTGASNANVVHNLLLGQQAACYAVTREPEAIKQESDYGNRQGNGISFDAGIEKVVYNGKDYGVIQVMTGGAAD
nr:MAG TPA: major capsid protein [Caudoviricetes sp.]